MLSCSNRTALAFPLLASFLNSDDLNVVTVSETLLSRLECVPPPLLRIVTLGVLRCGKTPSKLTGARSDNVERESCYDCS